MAPPPTSYAKCHPRPRERGPVEATGGERKSAGGELSIRAPVSAAPLKRLTARSVAARQPAIRAPVSAAPLKPVEFAVILIGAVITIRAPVSAAPLKHKGG